MLSVVVAKVVNQKQCFFGRAIQVSLLPHQIALQGIGSGKVIKSGPHDHIFVNFVDHGAPGIVAFVNDELASTDFMVAMKMMHKKKKYAKMVLYFEACESGSMFEGLLPKDIDGKLETAKGRIVPEDLLCSQYLPPPPPTQMR